MWCSIVFAGSRRTRGSSCWGGGRVGGVRGDGRLEWGAQIEPSPSPEVYGRFPRSGGCHPNNRDYQVRYRCPGSYKSPPHASYPSNCWYVRLASCMKLLSCCIDATYRRSSSNTSYITCTSLEEMAAFQRIIIFLIAIYAVFSVSAAPIEVCQQHLSAVISERSDSVVMMT